MSTDGLIVDRRGPVGWIIFDRPQAGNAMNAPMFTRLPEAWRELDADPDVRAIVVTGNGNAFQTGLDVNSLAKDPASLKRQTQQTRDAALELTGWHLGVTTPVIAAVNGVCAGGGLHFVVDADIVIASTTASFLDPHVSVGQGSNWEAVGLIRRIPAAVASRLVLVGSRERLSAERARQIGLVSEVVEPERIRDRAQELGEMVADADPVLQKALKQALWSTMELGRSAALQLALAEDGR
ncbi:MAG TPA: enoyl-CoA hydratase/isomerase family protein [Jatrophihabitans sp.]